MQILHSIGAVLAGIVFIVVTHTGTDFILQSMHVLPEGHLNVSATLILIVIGYRALYSIFGCYIAARLAPHKPMAHALTIGGIGVAMSTLGALLMQDLGPLWYGWALAVIALPSAWLGGKLAIVFGRDALTDSTQEQIPAL